MGWKTLDDMNFAGKAALVRVDLNVPVRDGEVTDTARIEGILPTIRHILDAQGKVVLLAHFGRPKGAPDPSMSLRVVLPALEAALGCPVAFADDCIGGPAKRAVGTMEAGEVVLLENTRFHAEEERNDPAFAASMAALADVYVNDAFSAAHRAHASTEGVARLLPSCAGRLMEAELKALEAALGSPERPVVAIVGGAKVSTKIALLENLVSRVDHLVIGGGMANTFLAAEGTQVGRSLCEHDMAETARAILAAARDAGCTVHLPRDIVVAAALEPGTETRTLPVDACPEDAMILDIGPETRAHLDGVFELCRTLIWNGPLGVFEVPPFDAGTLAAALKVAELTDAGRLVSVGGGGDTVAALRAAGVADRLTYLSGAGGAFLEWMEGRTLPGVAVLQAH
ncbi:phosphoglycerate kinase [Rhodobaculum claviforme]|uniref:Phosphoglycerate kinase n=1 Tax=Rhodobaculum claviforme TaxID=1549854 RepID=A0A934TKS6_9RHOB|nr:phosphoglycerate kinase [Rhodobaculum claviforme]MBK5927949.1 phosphoglycerate kinase [Rhodobaculum claviforme]